jgi:glyoxylase-like metal-dependent hydrolase (beta-lactamase superfamily II)
MYVKSFTFNPFQTNCFVCHDAGEAVIIDPSCHTERERQQVLDYLDAHDLTVRHLLLTHGHIDHIFGCKAFAEHFGMPWQMHRADVPMLKRAQEQSLLFGVPLEQPPVPETFLDESDTVTFGEATWTVLYTPGHSRGSICFHDARGDFVIAGDMLFAGSIGRTDLPGGSMPELMRSIFQKLIPLGDSTQVYPGHGPETTIGHERQTNPFLTDRVTG